MKKSKKTLLSILAISCLLVIGGVLTIGMLKNHLKRAKKEDGLQILGETTQLTNTPNLPSSEDVNQFVQETLESAKEKVVEKVKEAEKTILETINKEVENLTQSQIEALKLQICRDLGVITTAPTKNP